MKTQYWFDTEFMEDGSTIELISIGMVCEDGRELYCESSEADLNHANDWVKENVIPHLWSQQPDKKQANLWSRDGGVGGLMPRREIAARLLRFVDAGEHPARFWAYYADYDWVVLAQLFGRMVDMPESWPKFAMDIKQLAVHLGDPDLPSKFGAEHCALDDARWNRVAYDVLLGQAITSVTLNLGGD